MISKARILACIDNAGAFLTLLLPPLIVAGPAPADAAAMLITILFLLRSAVTRDISWLRPRWMQALLALWLFTSLRNLPLDHEAIVRATTWLRYIVFCPALALWTLQNPNTRNWLRRMLVISVVFLTIDTLWQYIHGTDLFGRPLVRVPEMIRLTGPYSTMRVGTTIAWLLFPVLLWCIAQPRLSLRAGAMLLTVASVLAVFVSGERTALLLVALGLVAAFVLLKRARLPLLIVFAITLAAGLYLMHSNPILKSRQVDAMQTQITGFADTVYGRMWHTSLAIGANHPWLGVGSKHYSPVCQLPLYGPTDTASLTERCPLHPHNMYLEWLVEGGVPALLLWLGCIGIWLGLLVKYWRAWWQQPLATGVLIACFLRLWPIAVVTSQFVSWSAVPLWLMIGWMLALLYAPSPDELAHKALDASA